jgi:hypothetical protein
MNKNFVLNSNSTILKSKAVIFFCLFCFTGIAQVNFQFKQKNQSDGTNILIRWAPLDYSSFYFGQTNGYKIIRTTLRQADTLLSGYQMYQSKIVLDSMILPLAEMDWEAMAADTNDIAGIAAMALYGEEVEVLSVDSVDFMEVANLNVSVRPTPSSPAFSGSVILPRTKYRKNESGKYKETRRMDGA